jgi:predicted MFS family arabinose efflux permease
VVDYNRRQQVIGRFLSGQILGQLLGHAAGGVLGDYFGWRNVFFILALLLGIATAGLFYELMRNPVTHASNAPARTPRGYFADYATVLRSPWARMVIAMAFVESGAMFGAYTYVGADLHLRFDLNFTLVGLVVGAFAIGGLIYSLSVHWLVDRLRQVGLAAGGGALWAAAYVTLAVQSTAWTAPLATVAIGLGFYMLHNTLQTNATQMTPEARGTAVAIFSSALYLGQTAGVAAGGAVFDRFTAVPVFLTTSVILLALGLWFARELKMRRA